MTDLSTKQASARLGISIPTVIAWIKNGSLDGGQVVHGKRLVWKCTEESVEQIRGRHGGGTWSDVEERIAALEALVGPAARPGTAKILRDWIAAEDSASRRRRQVIELLTGAASPGPDGLQSHGSRVGRPNRPVCD